MVTRAGTVAPCSCAFSARTWPRVSQEVAFHVVDRDEESWLMLDEALVEGARYRLSQEGGCAAPGLWRAHRT
jgi:hypothetical protein